MKFETRSSKSEASPKSEPRNGRSNTGSRSGIRISAFGFRIWDFAAVWALALLLAPAAFAQNAPHIGYVYPAGGQQGATFQLVVGGQYLAGVSNAYVSGAGVQARVLEYNRPLNQKEFTDLRDQLRELQERRRGVMQGARQRGGQPAAQISTNTWTAADEKTLAGIIEKILKNPPNRQGNPAIAETITVQVTMITNTQPGEQEIRLATPNGLSNPLVFCVGQLAEFSRPASKTPTPDLEPFLERLGKKPVPAKSETRITLPAIVNGQIMPGAMDRYRFAARRGQRLVVAASARALIPYLADAVPGWFQATLALYDAKGNELAYNDGYRFNPDPVLLFEIPADGDYAIEIKDSIYRGREDFVYRISIGELPFVTSNFPLGGPAGVQTTVELKGWNLPATNLTQAVKFAEPGVYQLSASNGDRISNLAPFAVDTLPECLEQEPNNTPENAQRVTLPILVNGRIDQPGDADVFRFEGRADEEVVAEVMARRLGSPLDSFLRLTDAAGKQIAFNDDHEDKGAGLETHHADSYLRATLPANGTFYVHLGDTQRKGGPEFGYRLRLSAPRPDFALRVVPSSLSVRAGASVPLTVYALRKDGFTNAITLELKDAPEGFKLSGAQVPANQDKVRFTLTAPAIPLSRPAGTLSPSEGERDGVRGLQLQGWAIIDGQAVFRPAVPAEDMMQAFAYRHLVPAREFTVAVSGRGMPPVRILSATPVKIPAGGTVRVRIGPVGPMFTNNFQLELSEPPEGVTLGAVVLGRGEAALELRCDAAKVKPGLKGNLIVNAFAGRPPATGRGQANNRRPAAGTLPTIPFEIVLPQ